MECDRALIEETIESLLPTNFLSRKSVQRFRSDSSPFKQNSGASLCQSYSQQSICSPGTPDGTESVELFDEYVRTVVKDRILKKVGGHRLLGGASITYGLVLRTIFVIYFSFCLDYADFMFVGGGGRFIVYTFGVCFCSVPIAIKAFLFWCWLAAAFGESWAVTRFLGERKQRNGMQKRAHEALMVLVSAYFFFVTAFCLAVLPLWCAATSSEWPLIIESLVKFIVTVILYRKGSSEKIWRCCTRVQYFVKFPLRKLSRSRSDSLT
jgi:hypothetical protein